MDWKDKQWGIYICSQCEKDRISPEDERGIDPENDGDWGKVLCSTCLEKIKAGTIKEEAFSNSTKRILEVRQKTIQGEVIMSRLIEADTKNKTLTIYTNKEDAFVREREPRMENAIIQKYLDDPSFQNLYRLVFEGKKVIWNRRDRPLRYRKILLRIERGGKR